MSNPYASPDPAKRPQPSKPPQASTGSGGSVQTADDGERRQRSAPEDPKGRPSPEQLAKTSRPVMHFGLFMLASVLTMQLHLPWQLASLAFAAGAAFVGVRAIVKVTRERLGGTIVVLLSFGMLLTGMLVLTSLGNLALWDEQMERQRCLSSAVTVSAQDACERQYRDAVEERFGVRVSESHPSRAGSDGAGQQAMFSVTWTATLSD